MEQPCETARGKTDSHIVIGLLPRSKKGRQKYDDKILYANRRLRSMSQDKGFLFLDLYWEFDGKPHLFADGLHLNSEGARVLGACVGIATQAHFWTKNVVQRSQPSSSGNAEGNPPATGSH